MTNSNVIQFPMDRVRRFGYTETTIFKSGLTIIYTCYEEGSTIPRSFFEDGQIEHVALENLANRTDVVITSCKVSIEEKSRFQKFKDWLLTLRSGYTP